MNERPEPITDTSPVSEASGAVGSALADGAVRASGERPMADLDRIERDLAGVETALQRLDAGTYWTDEATGESIPDEVLINDPVARRAG